MKFLGIFLLSTALYITWGLFNGSGAIVSEGVHMQIQQTLSKEIVQIIIDSNPSAYNIEVSDFWTETLDEENIKAHFKFEFEESSDEGESKMEKMGRVHLTKSKEDGEFQYWEASEVVLEGQKIEFKEGLVFSDEDIK